MASTAALDKARLRYIAEFPTFKEAAEVLRKRLTVVLRDSGIPDAHVKVRPKEISSFVKKLRRYGDDCWEKTTDKVGAQIVVHKLTEVRSLREVLEGGVEGLGYIETTDKSVYSGDPRKLRYTGVHVQMRLPDIFTSDNLPVECEIQLRTQAQDVWAYLEHGLIYKPLIDPSAAIARKIARLSVLVEMFDEEVDTVITELEKDPRYGSALLLHEAERWFLTFVSESGDRDLSFEVINQIKPSIAASEASSYGQALASFVVEHRQKIADAMRDYGSGSEFEVDFNYFLFTQPEALIVWERVERRPLALLRTIRDTELESAVAALADVWGRPLTLG